MCVYLKCVNVKGISIFQILEDRSEEGFIFFHVIKEIYEKVYNETVPSEWLKEANHRGIDGISFINPTDEIWILGLSVGISFLLFL